MLTARGDAMDRIVGLDGDRVLRETDVKRATRILRISWDEAWEIKGRAVARGRTRRRPHVPARLGVDETAVAECPARTVAYNNPQRAAR